MQMLNQGSRIGSQSPISTMDKVEILLTFVEKIHAFNSFEKNEKPFRQFMQELKELFREILQLMKGMICVDANQEALMVDFSFVALQSFREFAMINELDSAHCASVDMRIRDYLQDITMQTDALLKEGIVRTICSLDGLTKALAFPRSEDISRYIEFAESFMHENGQYSADRSTFKMGIISDKLYRISLLKGGNQRETLALTIETMDDLLNTKEIITGESEDTALQQENNDVIGRINDVALQCLRIMGRTLLKLSMYKEAVSVFDHLGEVSSVCEVYEDWIKVAKTELDKKTACREYADYCSKHGRIGEAIKVLQELAQTISSTKEIKEVNIEMGTILSKREEELQRYQQELQNWNKEFFSSNNDEQLRGILDGLRLLPQ